VKKEQRRQATKREKYCCQKSFSHCRHSETNFEF
jgi:hypothetical protein